MWAMMLLLSLEHIRAVRRRAFSWNGASFHSSKYKTSGYRISAACAAVAINARLIAVIHIQHVFIWPATSRVPWRPFETPPVVGPSAPQDNNGKQAPFPTL